MLLKLPFQDRLIDDIVLYDQYTQALSWDIFNGRVHCRNLFPRSQPDRRQRFFCPIGTHWRASHGPTRLRLDKEAEHCCSAKIRSPLTATLAQLAQHLYPTSQ
jgi:hypothetical protein